MICCRVVRFLLFLIGWRIELLDSFVDSFIKNLMIEMWQGKNIRREHVIGILIEKLMIERRKILNE